MPEMLFRLMPLHNNPKADFKMLIDLISIDPSLTAQLLHFANSSLFCSRRRAETLKEAITQSLGFDMSINLAIAISVSRAFKVQNDGRFGLRSFWLHALKGATFCHLLALSSPKMGEKEIETAYLIGLLHDFGILLIAHLQPETFSDLKKRVVSGEQWCDVEQNLLGLDHTELGSWLLEQWQLPEVIYQSCREHHNMGYSGPYICYHALLQLLDIYIDEFDHLKTAETRDYSDLLKWLDRLDLSEEQLQNVINDMNKIQTELDAVVDRIVI